jgi:hypothetical protein
MRRGEQSRGGANETQFAEIADEAFRKVPGDVRRGSPKREISPNPVDPSAQVAVQPPMPHRASPPVVLRRLVFILFFLNGFLPRSHASEGGPPAALLLARPGAILSADDDAMLDELERASFLYFYEQMNPVTGLVRDRALADGSPSEGKASISASGFALTSWAIAAHRGWVERPVALERVRLMLRFLADKAPRHHGFFYHFMEMDTGARAWKCELSSIDTGLFMAGAIIAREYFQDPEITELVNRIYREIDWKWFLYCLHSVGMGWLV